jgi:exopolysaccharide biosynthesis operon protein EpsL
LKNFMSWTGDLVELPGGCIGIIRLISGAACAALLLPSSVFAALDEGDHFQLSVADRYSYEDNLYRLAEDEVLDGGSSGKGASREDYINRVSVGMEGAWQLSEQTFHVTARMEDMRYQNNSDLDDTTGNARANWSWRLGSNLSGQLGTDYARFQAGFENNRFLQKDVVETVGTFWTAALRVGPHWRLRASARRAEIEHSAAVRRFDNTTTDSGTFGIQYETSRGDSYGWDYRYTQAHSKSVAILDGQQFDRGYEENTTQFSLQYALGIKTSLALGAGYLRREYPLTPGTDLPRGNFSGSTWDLNLQWRPTGKTTLNVFGWRKLRAYLDAETDYFVATGGSIEPVWTPTPKINVRLEYSIEDQDYLGPSVNIGIVQPRQDRVKAQQLTVTYIPLRMLQLTLSGRIEKRDSDRPQLQYDSRIANASIRMIF